MFNAVMTNISFIIIVFKYTNKNLNTNKNLIRIISIIYLLSLIGVFLITRNILLLTIIPIFFISVIIIAIFIIEIIKHFNSEITSDVLLKDSWFIVIILLLTLVFSILQKNNY